MADTVPAATTIAGTAPSAAPFPPQQNAAPAADAPFPPAQPGGENAADDLPF